MIRVESVGHDLPVVSKVADDVNGGVLHREVITLMCDSTVTPTRVILQSGDSIPLPTKKTSDS